MSAGDTMEETARNMTEALTAHIATMLERGESIDSIAGHFPATEAPAGPDEDVYYRQVSVDVPQLKTTDNQMPPA